jgi:hypothetical protein
MSPCRGPSRSRGSLYEAVVPEYYCLAHSYTVSAFKTAGITMNQGHAPQRRTISSPSLPKSPSRWKLVRDLGVFEAKLAVDGLKDIILAPLALAAVVADMVIPAESRGVFLRAVIRIGERFERWLNLYGARRQDVHSVLDEGGSDMIVDYLENAALDVGRGLRGRRRKDSRD